MDKDKRLIGVIPSRYNSSRFPGKPLADICGKPMVWWVYNQALKAGELDEVVIATDDYRIAKACEKYNMKYVMTSDKHDTPTSRLYEVSQKIKGYAYVFVGGDEPLIEPDAINAIASGARKFGYDVTHAMTKIKTAPEVIDFTNIKVVTSTKNHLLYTTRSPIPYPKGGLDFDYMKFVGIGAFTHRALDLYNATPKSKLEKIEECDLLRFLDQGMDVRMIEVSCKNVSVDTKKDLEFVTLLINNSI